MALCDSSRQCEGRQRNAVAIKINILTRIQYKYKIDIIIQAEHKYTRETKYKYRKYFTIDILIESPAIREFQPAQTVLGPAVSTIPSHGAVARSVAAEAHTAFPACNLRLTFNLPPFTTSTVNLSRRSEVNSQTPLLLFFNIY